MRNFLRWAVWIIAILLVAVFAVANRQWVTLSFDPFSQTAPRLSKDMPLWLLFFVGIFVGIIMGWVGSWLAQGKHRKAAREARAEVGRLQVELADLRKPRDESRLQDVVPFNGGML